jgi:hypothetical protein
LDKLSDESMFHARDAGLWRPVGAARRPYHLSNAAIA